MHIACAITFKHLLNEAERFNRVGSQFFWKEVYASRDGYWASEGLLECCIAALCNEHRPELGQNSQAWQIII